MSDPLPNNDEFLSYCELHSTTDRALFSRAHVLRLHSLAHVPIELAPGAFFAMHADVVTPLAERARRSMHIQLVSTDTSTADTNCDPLSR